MYINRTVLSFGDVSVGQAKKSHPSYGRGSPLVAFKTSPKAITLYGVPEKNRAKGATDSSAAGRWLTAAVHTGHGISCISATAGCYALALPYIPAQEHCKSAS